MLDLTDSGQPIGIFGSWEWVLLKHTCGKRIFACDLADDPGAALTDVTGEAIWQEDEITSVSAAPGSVSYTHLDVYKRQISHGLKCQSNNKNTLLNAFIRSRSPARTGVIVPSSGFSNSPSVFSLCENLNVMSSLLRFTRK